MRLSKVSLLSTATFAFMTFVVRILFIETYPYGFAAHAIVHADLRMKLYQFLFIDPLNSQTFQKIKEIVLGDQHGPQSLLEAILTPIFGFGFTSSRLLVGTLGILSVYFMFRWGCLILNRWFGMALGITAGMSPYCLYFSRYGDSEHVNIYLQGFLLIYWSTQTIIRGLVRDYLILGFIAGLSFYVYATNQLLFAIMAFSFIIAHYYHPKAENKRQSAINYTAFVAGFFLTVQPILSFYIQNGRYIPIRTPYGTPNYEFSTLGDIPHRTNLLIRELFVSGHDPWFARSNGVLWDWTLILLIPGLIWFIRSKKNKQIQSADVNRTNLFFRSSILGLILFGALPGLLSPEPTIRRSIMLLIGLDIIKAVGLYSILLYLHTRLSQTYSRLAIACTIAALVLTQWISFYYDSSSHESSTTLETVELIRKIAENIKHKNQSFVLITSSKDYLNREQFIRFLKFDLGNLPSIPDSVHLLEFSDLKANYKNITVLVPYSTLLKIQSSQNLENHLKFEVIRTESNRSTSTYA